MNIECDTDRHSYVMVIEDQNDFLFEKFCIVLITVSYCLLRCRVIPLYSITQGYKNYLMELISTLITY